MNIEKDDQAFIVSFLSHCCILLTLSLIPIINERIAPTIQIVSYPVQEIIIPESVDIEDINTFSEEETILSNEEAGEESLQINEDNLEIELQSVETVEDFGDTISNEDLMELSGSSNESNIGNSGVAVSGVGSAVDRLSREIVSNANDRPVVVFWLFDASVSLFKQRADIASRFEKVLTEIELSKNQNQQINHIVSSFGGVLKTITSAPTSDKDQLIKDILSIGLDESGIENVFGSIQELIISHKNLLKKNKSRMMVICFTDEVGDDQNKLEPLIVSAKQTGCMIYVVGVPSPFGVAKSELKYVDPDEKYDQTEKWVQIQQGPESFVKMTLNMKSLDIDNILIDSGFGSYSLSRLCQNTGGLYFALHPNRNSSHKISKKDIDPLSSGIQYFFDPNIMFNYKPDYRSIDQQTKEILSNKTKLALINACRIEDGINISGNQVLKFDARTIESFLKSLNKAQQFSAKLDPKIAQVFSILQNGEATRGSVKEKVWGASFDLAMGRIYATKCRNESYNLLLAEAKLGMKTERQESNQWELVHTEESIKGNSSVEKSFKLAKMYLNRVVSENPGTPWALVASEELKTPMGYKWMEGYLEPDIMKMNDNGNNIPKPPKDDEKKMLSPKMQRNVSKI